LSSLIKRVVAVFYLFLLWRSETTDEAGRFDDESL
jgi:hypothetical protein